MRKQIAFLFWGFLLQNVENENYWLMHSFIINWETAIRYNSLFIARKITNMTVTLRRNLGEKPRDDYCV